MDDNSIPKFVITGGPCGGKSSLLNKVFKLLSEFAQGDRSFHPVIVEEAATSLINANVGLRHGMPNMVFQEGVLRRIIHTEDLYVDLARHLPNNVIPVLLCDRGICDNAAYMPPTDYVGLLDKVGLDPHTARDRYDGVLHLVSTAVDKPECYSLDNPARGEDIATAKALDAATLNAWIGASHLKVIDNSTDLDTKVNRAVREICGWLGIPKPLEIERKYRVRNLTPALLPSHQIVRIEQHYLKPGPDGLERRVRMRSQNSLSTCTLTCKGGSGLVRTESERRISYEEFDRLRICEANPGVRRIVKHRHCFVYQGQYCEVDVFREPKIADALLEIELTDEHTNVTLPPFLDVIEEVTDDPRFSNAVIASTAGMLIDE